MGLEQIVNLIEGFMSLQMLPGTVQLPAHKHNYMEIFYCLCNSPFPIYTNSAVSLLVGMMSTPRQASSTKPKRLMSSTAFLFRLKGL